MIPDLVPGVGRAHGKAILLGEHTVVYGCPAIALPVPALPVSAQAWRAGPASPDSESGHAAAPGIDLRLRVSGRDSATGRSGLYTSVATAMREWGLHDDTVELHVHCSVPIGRGLGSSAACAAASVSALADLLGRTVEAHELHRLVQHGENVAHGRASGVDAWAAISHRLLWFEAGAALPLETQLRATLVIADTGICGSTRQAVELVAERLRGYPETRRLLDRAADLTRAAAVDLRTGDLRGLGNAMDTFQEILRQLGVSLPEIENLLATATVAGAVGAKLTGGGLGGCVLALADTSTAAEVADALTRAGAVRVWTAPLPSAIR